MHVNIILPLECVTALFDGRGLAEHHISRCGQLVKMLITLEQHDIFGSNFAYLFILTLSSHWYAKW